MKSIYLNNNWDLDIDSSGNIAIAGDPYALAQNAASAIRCFKQDCYYDQDIGIPYYENIIGERPSMEYLKAQFVAAAMTVVGVVSAKCFITDFDDRNIHGQVQVTDQFGNLMAANF